MERDVIVRRRCPARAGRGGIRAFLLAASVVAAVSPASHGEPSPLGSSEHHSRHVVLVVWDGMRPDFITEKNTPRLWELAKAGTRFANHHSVYPTSTEVNGAALATGVYPARSGLLANREYRPAIAAERAIDTGEREYIRRGDELTHGHYLAVPTLAETVRAAGLRTAIAGGKAVVFLHDRTTEWTAAVTPKGSFTVFAASPMPPALADETQRLLGPFRNAPAETTESRNTYTTRALTEVLWRETLPAFSLLWLSEPDLSQHETSPGAAPALAAIRNADDCLGVVLDRIGQDQASAETDVLVVSDHGFSTIERTIDLPALLQANGFSAASRFDTPPKNGDIMIVGNGGTVLFYVIGHDAVITARLVEWLQRSDFVGVLFAREKFEGTFPLAQAHLDTSDAPDVVMAFRWSERKNGVGIPGLIAADAAGRSVGKGSHASLSPYDVHNTFIAAGPDFPAGLTSDTPTGNIDIAPTILRILGLTPPAVLDGRAVEHAMTQSEPRTPQPERVQTEVTTRVFPDGEWRQHLKMLHCGKSVYLDEGNGAFTPK